ncbi:MAG: type II CAAX endopeptidase family protein [Flavobacteriales bacterium]
MIRKFELDSSERRQLILWTSLVVLVTIKIYQGDQSFFSKHFHDPSWSEPLFDWYRWLYHHIASLLLWCIVPMILIKTVLKENLGDFGWKLGDWKFGLKASIAAIIIMPLPVYVSSMNPEHREWYPLTTMATASAGYFALWGLSYLPHYIGWEFMFRGFAGMGFKKHYGAIGAIGIQVIITTLLHIGKPMGETWGAAVGGIYLGWLTYRTGSVWWAIIFHFYLGMLNTWMCS